MQTYTYTRIHTCVVNTRHIHSAFDMYIHIRIHRDINTTRDNPIHKQPHMHT